VDHIDADPDPTLHSDADPDPDPDPTRSFIHVGKSYIFILLFSTMPVDSDLSFSSAS
jgi:hypothetical protein